MAVWPGAQGGPSGLQGPNQTLGGECRSSSLVFVQEEAGNFYKSKAICILDNALPGAEGETLRSGLISDRLLMATCMPLPLVCWGAATP